MWILFNNVAHTVPWRWGSSNKSNHTLNQLRIASLLCEVNPKISNHHVLRMARLGMFLQVFAVPDLFSDAYVKKSEHRKISFSLTEKYKGFTHYSRNTQVMTYIFLKILMYIHLKMQRHVPAPGGCRQKPNLCLLSSPISTNVKNWPAGLYLKRKKRKLLEWSVKKTVDITNSEKYRATKHGRMRREWSA